MMAFNNELIVREISAFPVPVIAGIGHHRDMPLAAMAADVAVSTPTAAANLISQPWEEIGRTFDRYQMNIIGGFKNLLNSSRLTIVNYARSFLSFKYVLRNVRKFLSDSASKTSAGMKLMILAARQHLEYVEKTITLNDPERQLELGYSIVKVRGKVLKSITRVAVNDDIDIGLADGTLSSQVKKITKKHDGKN